MSGGVALFDFDNDGLLDIYFVDSLTVDTARTRRRRGARSTATWAREFEDVTDRAGVGHPGWGMGVCTADVDGDGWEDLYVTGLGRNRLYRNKRDGTFADIAEAAASPPAAGRRAAASPTTTATATSTSSSAATSRSTSEPAGVRQGQDLRVPRHRRAVRAARPAGRGRTSSSATRAAAASPRWARGRASPTRAATSASASPGSTPTATAGPTSSSPTTPRPTSSTRTRATAPSRRSPSRGCRGQRGRRRAGLHGRGRRRLQQQRPPDLFVTNFAEEYNAALPQRRRPLHRRLVPLGTAPSSLPYVGWGTAFLDYDNDGCWTSSPSTATSTRSSTRRASAPRPATASASSSTATAATAPSRRWPPATAGLDRGPREPRPGRGRPRQRRPPGRRHQRPRRRPPGAAQRARRARQLAARGAQGKGKPRAIGAVVTVRPGGRARRSSCAAARATSPRTTSASTSAWAPPPRRMRWKCSGLMGRTRGARTSRPTSSC